MSDGVNVDTVANVGGVILIEQLVETRQAEAG
jgi:hypothetical protein